jgi:hypothetical protein
MKTILYTKTTTLFLFILLISFYSFSQTTLYSEGFDGQNNKGARGSGPTIDLDDVTWDIDITDAVFSNNYSFRVRNFSGNGYFEARDVGTSIWLSPEIDISTQSFISFTIDAFESGNFENADSLTTQYRIDSGTWTNADTNGSLVNDFGSSLQVSQTAPLTGNTLEIRVIAVNSSSNEYYWIDNIIVTGSDSLYCTSLGTVDEYDTAITLVNFGAINNATGQGSGYDDFTDQSTSIVRGESQDLTININTAGDWSVYSYVWIDWNRDGDFDDANETYDLGFTDDETDGPTSNSALTITAPIDAEVGNTRMRVVCDWSEAGPIFNGPCDGSTDGEVEDYTVTILPEFTYTYDNDWLPSDPNGVNPIVNDILIVAGTATFSGDISCTNFTVNPGANVIVNSTVTIDVSNEMVLESTSTSYSSLILDGTINGNVSYKRHINDAAASGTTTGANDLISPPLSGQTFGAFRAANPNILSGTISGNPAFLFGPFNPATLTYTLYAPSDDISTLDAGIGYRTGSTDGSTYTFTGTIEKDEVDVPLVSGGASNWNLIGNPYPSYINAQAFLSEMASSGLIDENATGIYGYDGSASNGWTIYNLATTTPDTVITPGQGFFINAEVSGTIAFTPEMRATGSDDDFILGRNANPLVFLKLQASNSTKSYSTDFYFNDNATLGLDLGYDASIWNDTAPNFAIYSQLVANNTGKAYAIQALHSSDLLNVTIPLGVNTNNASPLTFSILESTLPATVSVYLEDKVTNTMTLLTNEDYQISLDSSISTAGRFFLIFMDTALSTNEIELDSLNIYTSQTHKTVIINGNLNQKSDFKLFDIQGRQVANKVLDTNTHTQSVDVSNLHTGVYVVHIQNMSGIKTKKIIIN